MGEYRTLALEQDGGVALLTLDQPEKRNAMTAELTREFPEAVRAVKQDAGVRALVITGTGTVFCAGGDLTMLERMLDQSPDENRREMGEFYRAYLSILHLDIPVIAAINGHALGAGIAFTLGCDLRILAETARVGFTFINLGLHPGMATTHLLPQVVGTAMAADLMLTGRQVTASEALAMGLVSRVAPAEQVVEEAMKVAREMAAKPASAVRMAKRALVRPKLEGLEAALDYEANAQQVSYASEEMRALLTAARRR